MNIEDGVLFLFFIIMVLWTIKADFFLLIFVAAAYIFLLFLPINFDVSIPPELIMETLNSVITRLPGLFIFLSPLLIYNIYIFIRKAKKTEIERKS